MALTVKDFAKVLKIKDEALLERMKAAGLPHAKASDEITRMRFKKDDNEDDDEVIASSKQDRIPIPRKNDLNLDVSNSTRDSSNYNIIQNIKKF